MPNADDSQGRGAELRRTPRVGDRVCIVHLAAWEDGTVLTVHDGGRRVEVRGEEEGVTHESCSAARPRGSCRAAPMGPGSAGRE